MQALNSAGMSRWGDKTPGYLTEMQRLHGVFPDAKFLHVIRDGRDVCLSLKKTGWRGLTSWEIAQYWAGVVGEGWRQGRALPADAYMEVEYEALVTNTEKLLRRVCAFLGEDFEPAMLEFYRTAADHLPRRDQSHLAKTYRPPSGSDVARWRKEMSTLQVAIFETFAGSVIDLVGQDRRFRFRIPLLRRACLVLAWVAQQSHPFRRRFGIHFSGLARRL